MIKLENIDYTVSDRDSLQPKHILRDINVTFPTGKVTVITGHNGSGKSTLIKLIMGIVQPTHGAVYYDGRDITGWSIHDRARAGMTLAFQTPVKFKGLTVRDLLDTASHGRNKLYDACEYLSQVGLCAKDYIDRPLDDTLSGGELKRIELAMALAKGGEVFLFDEPEAGIDLWSFDSLISVFQSLKDKTVIIVSHQKKILDIADYILLLDSTSDAQFGDRDGMMTKISSPKCRKLGGLVNG